MRAVALFAWIFINLVCFGMCGYIYLIWSQYWLYIEKQRLSTLAAAPDAGRAGPERYVQTDTAPRRKRVRSAVGVASARRAQQPDARPASSPVRSGGRPRFPDAHRPILELDSDKYACDDDDCGATTAEFKELVLKEFHRVLMAESDVFKSGEGRNAYEVRYNASKFGPYREKTRRELLCELKRIPVRTVAAEDEPFGAESVQVPRAPPLRGRAFRTCAVVTSAGALRGSGLGAFIDSHDMVVRFNNAPTDNFTEDVGARTSLRVLNSQVMARPEFGFESDPLYRGVALLAWDPARYSATLQQWYRRPDFPLFDVYKRYLDAHTQADAHLLHPAALWALWDFLQSNSPYRLRKNPPSSGFIGIWFALWRCARVRVAEFVPSTRATRRCHYYRESSDPGCTLGSWHPLAQEKAIAERLRDNSDAEVFQRGYIDVPGLSTVRC